LAALFFLGERWPAEHAIYDLAPRLDVLRPCSCCQKNRVVASEQVAG
jgi:hypothetical protein